METNKKDFHQLIAEGCNIVVPTMDITSIIEKVVAERKPLTDFETFFSLPDGEKLMGFFWHDKDGNETYDPEKLTEKVPFYVPQTKYATTNEDFELIYKRELTRENLEDTLSFKRWIIATVTEMRDFEQALPAEKRKRSIELQDIADKFLKWIDGKDNEGEKTLQTIFDDNQLAKLHKALLKEKYIKDIAESDFIYWLSGKPLNGMAKIKWIPAKSQLAYLLAGTRKDKECICVNFNFSIANKCFEVNGKKLDSNDRPISGYSPIEDILKTLRPLKATPKTAL